MTLAAFIAFMLATPTRANAEAVIARLNHDGYRSVTVVIGIDEIAIDRSCVHHDWVVDADDKHWNSPPKECH